MCDLIKATLILLSHSLCRITTRRLSNVYILSVFVGCGINIIITFDKYRCWVEMKYDFRLERYFEWKWVMRIFSFRRRKSNKWSGIDFNLINRLRKQRCSWDAPTQHNSMTYFLGENTWNLSLSRFNVEPESWRWSSWLPQGRTYPLRVTDGDGFQNDDNRSSRRSPWPNCWSARRDVRNGPSEEEVSQSSHQSR